MNKLLKQLLLVCVCLFALSGQATADSLPDAERAYNAKDYAKAAKLFRPLAEQGNAKAQFNLGLMYGNGQGVPQDYKETVKWYRLAAEQGDASAQYNLGLMYRIGQGVPQDYKEAVKWYRLAAEQGDADAQEKLGIMYEFGKGVPQDYVLAYMWYNIPAANTTDSENKKLLTEFRDSIAKHMTAKQIAEAQELAIKCTANKFKGC
jgi:TPR repeat protein